MKEWLSEINSRFRNCGCTEHAEMKLDGSIGRDALKAAVPYLLERGFARVTVVADRRTLEAAGRRLCAELETGGIRCDLCILQENESGDIAADEAAVVQVLLSILPGTDAVFAVGAGTVHDIVRFACFKADKPFLSVPTAASVDGFTSAGAPLIIRGRKVTVQAAPPAALFADAAVLSAAPRAMTAAGLGDMLAKFTSLADWKFSRDMAGESFCPAAYGMTEEALSDCISNMESIAAGSEEGVLSLFRALLLSGFAMQAAGHSRSASGAEHHLSHYWEMAYIRAGRPQLLHGAKVGVATVIVAELYRKLAAVLPSGQGEPFASLPAPELLQAWLRKAGGPASPADLGLPADLLAESLKHAHTVRDRYTGLYHVNVNGIAIAPGAIITH